MMQSSLSAGMSGIFLMRRLQQQQQQLYARRSTGFATALKPYPQFQREAFSIASFSTASSSSIQNATPPKSKLRLWLSVAGGIAVAAIGALTYELGGTEGLSRSVSFYSIAIPKYCTYRYHSYIQSPNQVWEQLDKETSKQGLAKILSLEGFYIKCGQLVAANIGNAFPPIWQDTMSVLQDQVPPQSFSVIENIIKSEMDLEKTFVSMEPEPIGSASIGQVHRAVLRDTNNNATTRVVVKVCYPNVERLLRGDVRTIKLFAQLAQPVHVPALIEIEKQFQKEFDYRIEADHLQTVHDNLTRAGIAGPRGLCIVPRPYLKLCTKRVLVMEELMGEKLAVGLKRDAEHFYAERFGKSTHCPLPSSTTTEDIDESERVGPSTKEYDAFISLVDTKRRIHNLWAALYNATAGLVGASKHTYKDKSELPINHAKLIDDLFYIHGHEVLVDGVYNADPHPGNILICRKSDGSPQLGLIDYGQTQRLSKEQRHLFAKILIALDTNNKSEVVRLMKVAGFESKNMDPEVICLYAKVSYDEDNKELTNGKHIQMFLEDLEARDPILSLPTAFLMVSRASTMIRGLAHAIHQPRSTARAWRPIAERILRDDI
jgi:aarF domain-containing kinase